MNKDIFKKAFENVKPPEELVNKALDIQSIPAVTKKAKRRGFSGRRIFATAAAVCGILMCGVTAAAATGIIDFEALFGGRFFSEDNEFADTLMGTVKDFSYKVSDEDYKISVKGITGSDDGFDVVAEISRVDGEPVADHFVNSMEIFYEDEDFKNYVTPSWLEQGSEGIFVPVSYDSYVNSEKNIELYVSVDLSLYQSSESITIRGENFYPSNKYWDFMKENNVFYVRYQEPEFSGYVYSDWTPGSGVSNEDFIPVDFDDSSIIYLDLEWEISFTPVSSKNAEKGKKAKKFDEDFVYLENVYDVSDGFSFVTEFERVVTPTAIDVKALGTDIEYTFTLTDSEYEHGDKYTIIDDNINNEIFLIFKDGSTLAASRESDRFSINDSDTGYKGTMHIVYRDFTVENSKETVIKVKDVKAISINGTVYELK